MKSLPLIAAVLGFFSAQALGQLQPQPPAPAPAPQEQAKKLPPQLLLGQRVMRVQQAAGSCDTLVIVTDATSYVQAIAHWTPIHRFPVLIDDGTPLAHEDIARFVRGFKPAHIVRWSSKAEKPAAWDNIEPDLLFATVAKVWGVQGDKPTQAQLLELWKKVQYQPPGIVVTEQWDGAWPAALALAAGRGEPVAFVTVRQTINGFLTQAEADDFEQAVEAAAEVSGFPWRGLGEGIDAVTLCSAAPSKLEKGNNEFLALTDRIGRVSKGIADGERWAWCGQIFGNPEQSCYRAMCALFIATHKSWVFDGYGTGKPWSDWDGTEAAKVLKDNGLAVELDDTPKQGSKDWRLRAARPVDAELILVNSSGNCDFFNLQPGQCRPGDIPELSVPAALHLVHSWSAQFPATRELICGRWLERGVFAYAGSVNEPYLQAFVETPRLAGRLIAGCPFGAAVRRDGSPLWKVAVFGDPLYTLVPQVRKVDQPTLEGAVDVADGLRELLTAGQYAKGIDLLTLLGRDAEAAGLIQTLLKEKADAVTPEVAAAGVPALMRAGDNRGVLAAYKKLDAAKAKEPMMRDYLWLATYPMMMQPDDDLLRTLRANLRTEQIGRDATELATAWSFKHGRDPAETMLQEVRAGLTDKDQIELLEKAARESAEKWNVAGGK